MLVRSDVTAPLLYNHSTKPKELALKTSIIASLLFSLSLLIIPATGAETSRPPNIVLILADDLGWTDLGCYGGTRAKTPAIDRLASEGIRFTQFYVNAPICSPSRVAFLTGQYPNRWRITSFLETRASDRARGMADWLDPKAPSVARILHDAGYYTAHVGKWHMGGQRDVGDAPTIDRYGFDTSLTSFEGLGERVLPIFRKARGRDRRGRNHGQPGIAAHSKLVDQREAVLFWKAQIGQQNIRVMRRERL